MGFRLTTMQISGKDRAAIWRVLGVRPSGAVWPHPVEGVSGRTQRDGAYLVVAMDDMGRHAETDLLRALSDDAHLLVCQIHEGCMCSRVAGWRNGEQIWAVEYGSEEGPRHLDVVGTPPPELAAIRTALETRQAAEPQAPLRVDHIFAIAPALYAALTGYEYDRIAPAAVFDRLIPL